MTVEFRLLGPLELVRDGEPVPLTAAKQRLLLADLLVHRGETVSVDRLVDDLWPEAPPADPRHALEAHASRLRGVLDGAADLLSRSPGYVLEVAPDTVDVVRFERLVAEARGSGPDAAAALAAEALALWRGPPLADCTYEPFAQSEIRRLEELRREALNVRIDAELALGSTDLVPELEALVAADPSHERLVMQLMLALYRGGRQTDALAAYRAAHRRLAEDFGVEPTPELRALEAQILRHDPALAGPAPLQPVAAQRKLATILFADVADSTGLAVTLDPEALRGLMRRYFDIAAEAVARHGGTVEKFAGDAVMAVFGTPVAHEDDALRAARAAVEIRDAIALLDRELERTLGVRLAVRLGLASGEVLTGGPDEPMATGPATIVSNRLQQEVGPGEIAVDALTRRLTAAAGTFDDLGDVELRGLRRPTRAFRLVELSADAPALERRLDAPLVGREQELAVLRTALADAVAARELRAVTVVGAPGVGKSRLVRELAASVAEDATVLLGRCNAYGEGSAFRPLRDALGDADAIAAVFGEDGSTPADEVPWAFRRHCEHVAAERPLVLVLDDLHWAEPALLDLVEYLAGSSSAAPIALVCIARDDLAEERPAFPGSGERVALEPLSDEETGTLAGHLLPESSLDEATYERLVAAAEGNPLFLEQLVAHIAETGLLEPPPTLRALLGARLDRLGPGERGVLERASVVGREFGAVDVAELLDPSAAPTAAAHLEALVRRGFVRAVNGGFRFRHWLIHDAAYRAAPKELRAELHERFADILARAAADDELVGYHLEQAYRLLTELAPPDRHALRLAEDGGRRLGSAGIRAWKRSESDGASRLLSRAVGLLPEDDEERRDLLCELGAALIAAGDNDGADRALRDALETARRTGDRRIESRAEIELFGRHLYDDPQAASERLLALAPRALPHFELLHDDRSLGRTLILTGWVEGGMRCQYAVSKASAERALAHYRRAGWPVATCLGLIASAECFGPSPVPSGIDRCASLLDTEVTDRAGEANVLVHLGGLRAMRGDAAEALSLVEQAQKTYADLGRTPTIASTCLPMAAGIALSIGDLDAAEEHLRGACASLERMRNRNSLASVAAELAGVLLLREELAESETWIATARRDATEGDVDAQIRLRSVDAKRLARRGEHAEAVAMGRSAVELAETTDATNRRARTLLEFAAVLDMCGRSDDGAAYTADAVTLYEEKGNIVEATAVRRAQKWQPPARPTAS